MNCCQRAFLCVRAVKLKSRAHVIELFQVNDAEQVFPEAFLGVCVCVCLPHLFNETSVFN